MGNTILITGASSGIGKATATLFHSKGWNVVATMRSPDKEQELTKLSNVLVTRLDVTDDSTIKPAIDAGIIKFGKIDVLLNNAGYGAFGPLEASSKSRIERQFDTNVIGLLETTKALIPHFRKNRSGVIVNISSGAGRIAMPLGALYHGTKFAVEGISESLQYELGPIGIKVKVVEPGVIATDFGGRSFDFANDVTLEEYQPIVQKILAFLGNENIQATGSPASLVANVIWEAVTDGTNTLRYAAGEDVKQYLDARKALSDDELFSIIRARLGA
jgi:NAD(P)-dependent dehydrogenase (short-subunit alcohol dehydrogenase family)